MCDQTANITCLAAYITNVFSKFNWTVFTVMWAGAAALHICQNLIKCRHSLIWRKIWKHPYDWLMQHSGCAPLVNYFFCRALFMQMQNIALNAASCHRNPKLDRPAVASCIYEIILVRCWLFNCEIVWKSSSGWDLQHVRIWRAEQNWRKCVEWMH